MDVFQFNEEYRKSGRFSVKGRRGREEATVEEVTVEKISSGKRGCWWIRMVIEEVQ